MTSNSDSLDLYKYSLSSTEAKTVDCLAGARISDSASAEYGSGSNNGVNYSYTRRTRGRTGRYECCIHRYFLDSDIDSFFTDPFLAAGYQWKLKAEKEDGRLFLSLKSASQEDVDVCYFVDLVNNSDRTRTVQKVGRNSFEPGCLKRFCGDFGSVVDIGARNGGYIIGGCFCVVVGVGLMRDNNETLAFRFHGNTLTLVWRLRYVEEMMDVNIISHEIDKANASWNLKLTRPASTTEGDKFGLYLHCLTESPIDVKAKVCLFNHDDKPSILLSEHEHTFGTDVSRECRSFVEAKALLDPALGFRADGWVTFIAPIEIKALHERSSERNETEGKCVVCLDKEQTSGFVHGETSHKCVCADCCRLLHRRGSKCPVCLAEVDSIVISYF